MECLRCGADNRESAQFCRECGASLAAACPNCRAAIEPGSKFCDSCGTALMTSPIPHRFSSPEAYTPPHLAERILSSKSALEGERKQVTVMFADLKSSLELLADRDPEEARRLLDPVLERMIDAVHRYEGTVNQVMGDGIMALFGAPIAHEDHAVRACYAALKMQESVRRYSDEVRRSHGVPLFIRVGLNSGEVVVRSIGSDLHMDYTAVGQTTHLAARMEQMAMPGSVLTAPATLQLAEGFVDVRPLGPAQIKGLQDPIELFELTGARAVRSRLHAAAARGLTKFVGRDAELAQLHRALEHAASGHGQVVAVVGEPGVGKSRLVWEATHSHRLRDWLVLESYSVSYGKVTPWLPAVALIRSYCRINESDDPREVEEKLTGKILTLDRALEPALLPLKALLDVATGDVQWTAIDPRQRRERTLEAIKQLLFRESQIQPLLLVFEDLHWIDTETQALLDSLVEALPASRMLMLVNYRLEYQHRWGSKTYYTQIRLDPLAPERAEELLQGLLGRDRSLTPLKSLLIERTGGNPFFLEESVRALVETHVLAGEPGAYRLAKPADAIQVPPTVQTVLAARIDRLSQDEKRLLQTAAVLGKDVPFRPLAEITDVSEPDLRRVLERLQAAEFLYETRLFPDSEYTFKHALTYEVAYGSLLQDRRRELHRRAGETLERLYADRTEEVYSALARHFAEGGEVEKGLRYSVLAAEKAAALYAYEEAVQHFERAKSLAERLSLRDRMAEIDEAIGDVELRHGQLEQAVAAFERALAHPGDRLRQAKLKFKISRVYSLSGDPRGLPILQAALKELDPERQRAELVHAQALRARYHHYAGEHSRALEVLKEAYAMAESLDDVDLLTTVLSHLAGACQHLARHEESMNWARLAVELGERKNFPFAVLEGYEFMAENLANVGRWDEAIAFSDREYRLAASVGAMNRMAWAMQARAQALMGKGHLRAALDAIRTTATLAQESGEKRLGLWCDARLAMILTDLGDDSDAREAALHGMRAADDQGDRVLRVFTRLSLAYLHLQRERWNEAAAIFEETAEILGRSDNRLTRIHMRVLEAETLLGLGRLDDADATAAGAVELARETGYANSLGVALSIRGRVLGAINRWDDAAHALNEAVTTLSEIGSELNLARACFHRSRLRLAVGDASGAELDLAEALRLFSAIDARPDRERAERVLAEERVRG